MLSAPFVTQPPQLGIGHSSPPPAAATARYSPAVDRRRLAGTGAIRPEALGALELLQRHGAGCRLPANPCLLSLGPRDFEASEDRLAEEAWAQCSVVPGANAMWRRTPSAGNRWGWEGPAGLKANGHSRPPSAHNAHGEGTCRPPERPLTPSDRRSARLMLRTDARSVITPDPALN